MPASLSRRLALSISVSAPGHGMQSQLWPFSSTAVKRGNSLQPPAAWLLEVYRELLIGRMYQVCGNILFLQISLLSFFLKILFALERFEDKAFPGVTNRRDTCRTGLASRIFYNRFAYNGNNAGSERLSANGKAFLEIPPLWDKLFLFLFLILLYQKFL